MIPLLAAYIVLACLYSIATPIFEASDEQWHYPMVKYLADHALALPVQDPANPGLWRQEGGQPPLYYMLGALLTSWIDTFDLESVRNINPHADIGVVVPDGNFNMAVHDPTRESFPWHNAVLAIHIVRLLSVALGAITVVMTYWLARELFPAQPAIWLGAAALTAFNPMFLFISGSVNNDNLSNALASALLVLIVRLVNQTKAPRLRDLVLIGVVAGAGMLAKFNIGFLLPLVGLALAIIAWRLRDPRPLIVGGLVTGGLTVLIAAWWYIRNVQLYGDPTGLNVFLKIVGPRPIPANAAQLWSERHTFLMSYWGFFGGVNVPLPDFVYTIFNGIAALSSVGVALWLMAAVLPHQPSAATATTATARRLDAPLPVAEEWGVRALLIGRLFSAIWIMVLFVSLLRWTSVTWASQGRLMFAAVAPLSLWMSVGLWQLGRGLPPIRWRVLTYSTVFFMLIAVLSPLALTYAYNRPEFLNHVQFDLGMPYNHRIPFCEPGQTERCLFWYGRDQFQAAVPVGNYFTFVEGFDLDTGGGIFPYVFSKNWSVFIHLENEDGLIVAQRDVYPRQGQWATRLPFNLSLYFGMDWRMWPNRFAIHIPDNAYAPQTLRIYMGFYDLATGERMIVDTRGLFPTKGNSVLLGTVQLLPRASELKVPNPAQVNFGGEAELVGYDLSALSLAPGQPVKLTLYWRALHKMSTDYRVFTHILDPKTTTIFGQDDAMPAAWTRPTTSWQPGEIIKDEHVFTINPDAPLGTWQIEIGMYEYTQDQQFRRLRVVTPDGGEAIDYLYLSLVKIGLRRDYF